jgi:hypothetical protein
VHSAQFAFWDWGTFARAAADAGSPELLRPKSVQDAFTYLPGAAWLLAPLRHTPDAVGFGVNAALMLAAAAAAAFAAHRIYELSTWFCLALILAWAPTTYALVIGQNGPLGLLLVLLSLLGFTRGAPLLTALPLALLLYKPTFAIPLIGLLVLRRRGRELSIVALGAAVWYVASVAATGGDWAWPRTLAGLEHAFYALDFAHNRAKAIGLTTLLIRAGAPSLLVAALAVLLVAGSLPALVRVPGREAYAAACLLGLVVSPHAWTYDAVLVLPMIFVTVTSVDEPARTRLVCAAYALAPTVIFAQEIGFAPLAIVVIGAFAGWLAVRSRRPDSGRRSERRRVRGRRRAMLPPQHERDRIESADDQQ